MYRLTVIAVKRVAMSRQALQRLIRDVESGNVDFQVAYFTRSRTPVSRDRGQRFTLMADTISR
jgi:hypothetical protein